MSALEREIAAWLRRNARELELCLWRFHFEGGSGSDVADALLPYQNEDGGFGRALEPDCWNPESSPYTTGYAIRLLEEVGWDDRHPACEGALRYLKSGKDLAEYGWRFSIPGNDGYPGAPWWRYDEQANRVQSLGLTAELSAFTLTHLPKRDPLYARSLALAESVSAHAMEADELGDMGLGGLLTLIETLKRIDTSVDVNALETRVRTLVKRALERDAAHWQIYGARPSGFIHAPNEPCARDNAELVNRELDYLLATKPEGDVWGITWTWFDNMERYGKQFAVSETWWKAIKAIEYVRFLRAFERS